MKQIIQTQIDKISAECSSIYSKEDVIKILTTIGNTQDTEADSTSIESILKEVYIVFKDKIESEYSSNIVDFYSAEFKIDNCTEVVLDDIKIEENYLCVLLKDSIDQAKNSIQKL